MGHARSDTQITRLNMKNIINTVLCTLFLTCIAFCYGIFNSEPSLGYLILFYAAFFMLILSIAQIILIKSKRRIWTGIITISSTLALVMAAMNNAPNESLMKVGQFATGFSFMISLSLYVLIWKK